MKHYFKKIKNKTKTRFLFLSVVHASALLCPSFQPLCATHTASTSKETMIHNEVLKLLKEMKNKEEIFTETSKKIAETIQDFQKIENPVLQKFFELFFGSEAAFHIPQSIDDNLSELINTLQNKTQLSQSLSSDSVNCLFVILFSSIECEVFKQEQHAQFYFYDSNELITKLWLQLRNILKSNPNDSSDTKAEQILDTIQKSNFRSEAPFEYFTSRPSFLRTMLIVLLKKCTEKSGDTKSQIMDFYHKLYAPQYLDPSSKKPDASNPTLAFYQFCQSLSKNFPKSTIWDNFNRETDLFKQLIAFRDQLQLPLTNRLSLAWDYYVQYYKNRVQNAVNIISSRQIKPPILNSNASSTSFTDHLESILNWIDSLESPRSSEHSTYTLANPEAHAQAIARANTKINSHSFSHKLAALSTPSSSPTTPGNIPSSPSDRMKQHSHTHENHTATKFDSINNTKDNPKKNSQDTIQNLAPVSSSHSLAALSTPSSSPTTPGNIPSSPSDRMKQHSHTHENHTATKFESINNTKDNPKKNSQDTIQNLAPVSSSHSLAALSTPSSSPTNSGNIPSSPSGRMKQHSHTHENHTATKFDSINNTKDNPKKNSQDTIQNLAPVSSSHSLAALSTPSSSPTNSGNIPSSPSDRMKQHIQKRRKHTARKSVGIKKTTNKNTARKSVGIKQKINKNKKQIKKYFIS